jgi:signal transduction histidine kinase
MKNLNIFYKIFFSYTFTGLISLLALAFIFYDILSGALLGRTIDQLSSINILKKNQIEMHLSISEKSLAFFFNQGSFNSAYQYISLSRNDLYPESFSYFTKEASELKELHDYDALLVFDKELNRIYQSGKLSSSEENMIRVQIEKEKERKLNSLKIADASIQEFSENPLLVYIIPLKTKDSLIAGYTVIKERMQKIQDILHERTGMGNTGESYIVGEDLFMRSSSRFFPDSLPLTIKVNTIASLNAFENKIQEHEIKDYRGVDVLSYYRPIEIPGLNWVIISEIDVSEAMRPIHKLKSNLILVVFTMMVLILLITSFLSNAISKPVLYLKEKIIDLSKGIIPDKEVKIRSKDEIGEIAAATSQLIEGLKRTAEFANQIGSGNFNVSYEKLSDKDSLGDALINMRDKLKMLTEREVKLVRERAAALMEGQEKERSRIIRELHDGVGQLLTVINLRLEALEDDSQIKSEIKSLVKETIAEVRRISYNVMPGALVDFGLEAALKGLLENIKKYSGLEYDITYVRETDLLLSFDLRIAMFRIAQEALNNIIKHSSAKKVELFVIKTEEEVYMMIKDNGKGFGLAEAENKGGFGLRSMKERAKLLNGDIEIHSEKDKGTIIEVHIPALYEKGKD